MTSIFWEFVKKCAELRWTRVGVDQRVCGRTEWAFGQKPAPASRINISSRGLIVLFYILNLVSPIVLDDWLRRERVMFVVWSGLLFSLVPTLLLVIGLAQSLYLLGSLFDLLTLKGVMPRSWLSLHPPTAWVI